MNAMAVSLGARPRAALALIAIPWFASILPAAAADAAPAEEAFQLPDIAVYGLKLLPPPESWHYARLADGTEVLSNTSEARTRRTLANLQVFQQALSVVWPLPARLAQPRTLILCGRHDKFADFSQRSGPAQDIATTSRLLRNREQSAIVVDTESAKLQLNGLISQNGAATSEDFEVDPDKQLYREFARSLLSQGEAPAPAWLQEGIAQIVMAMEFTPDSIIFGKVEAIGYADSLNASPATAHYQPIFADGDPFDKAVLGDRSFTVALAKTPLVSWQKFFAVSTDAPEANHPLGNNRWAKQAYAFVHFCLYGENGRYRQALAQFVQRLGTDAASETLFQECFRMSYAQMTAELRGYIQFTAHGYRVYRLKAGGKPLGGPVPALREATQAEIGRIKGDAQRLAGHLPDALESYRDAYARGERDPALLASLGVAESEGGHPDRARGFLEAAVKHGSRRSSAYLELARLRLADEKKRADTRDGRLSDAQLERVLDPLFAARKFPPALPETYDIIAATWSLSAIPPTSPHLNVLTEGLLLFPRNPALLYPMAELYVRAGDPATAVSLAQAGERLSPDDDTKARFAQLIASLPPGVR